MLASRILCEVQKGLYGWPVGYCMKKLPAHHRRLMPPVILLRFCCSRVTCSQPHQTTPSLYESDSCFPVVPASYAMMAIKQF